MLAVTSFLLFVGAVLLSFYLEGKYGFIVGGVSLFAMLISVYGLIMGLSSFSEENCMYRASIIGSISNGIIAVAWLGFYLMGV